MQPTSRMVVACRRAHSLFRRDTGQSTMANTAMVQPVRCCVTALLFLSPLMASAAVVGPHNHPEQHQRPDIQLPSAAATATRHKRWSTTFGSTQNKNISVPAAIRECTTDSDCLDTHYTSCAIDSTDRKRRCLCADGKQPSNGECLKKPRGPLFVPALRSSCETDLECLPNAICLQNGTASNPRLKICTCKDGFIEENEACNYASYLTFNYAAILVIVLTSWFWNDRLA